MSNMDFFQIGAIKVFAELGQLIEEDESKQIKFMDLPIDIIQNNILNHLKKDKTINKIFYDKDDYYLQNLLCGKLEKMNYIKTDEWDDFKTDLNLDSTKEFININYRRLMGRITFFSKLFQTHVFLQMFLEKCHLEKLFFQKVIIQIWRSSEKIVTCTPWSRYISDVFTPWSR
jgi:hydroxymethylpyrimidine pyrophosphatase-like HAD family hydrolase